MLVLSLAYQSAIDLCKVPVLYTYTFLGNGKKRSAPSMAMLIYLILKFRDRCQFRGRCQD